MRALLPPDIAPPMARYVHGVEIPAGYRVVMTSGQLGLDPDGTVPDGALEQARYCFAACGKILNEAQMGPSDVVRVNAWVTSRDHMQAYMQARDEWFASVPWMPASTLLIVSGFTRTEFLVEVEITAAAP